MKAEEFKYKVKEILGSDINFDGHVDLVISNITEDKQEIILNWIRDCKEGNERPEPCKRFKNLITFIADHNNLIPFVVVG